MKSIRKLIGLPFNKTALVFVLFFFFSLPLIAINGPLNLRRGCKAFNDSDVVVKWNQPSDICGSFQSYHIYARKDSFSPFNLIDSVNLITQTQYTHKGAFLLANSWQYFIIIHFDCSGQPTISSDTITIDLTQTANQFIDSVSVDPVSGKYIVGWKTNTSLDLAGYKIYIVSGANNIIIGDVSNSTNLFSDFSSNPSSTTRTYSIAAYDSCNNITAIIDKHTPILLSVSFDSCSRSFSIKWNAYIGFNSSRYEILASINGGGYYTVKTIGGSFANYNETISDTAFHDGDNVCFRVRVFGTTLPQVSSTSNTVCYLIKFINQATINYISQINVISNSQIQIDWLTDDYSLVSKLTLQQSTDGIIFKNKISLTPLQNNIVLLADTLQTDVLVYYYRIIIYNTCNQIQDTSLVCNSILLNAIKISSASNKLTWNKYNLFDAGVNSYEVFQGTGDPLVGHTFSSINNTHPDSIYYNDNNFPQNILNDGVCYYVVANENSGNQYGVSQARCKSNEVCVPGSLIVYFPNAFNPNSQNVKNTVFKPSGVYIDYTNSWLKVYNRWGELVYETNDLLLGWNGNDMNGSPLPPDQYVFCSLVASLKDKDQNIKGTVNLIR